MTAFGAIRQLFCRFLMVLLIGAFFSCAKKQTLNPPAMPGPMLHAGLINVETPDFKLSLVKSSQTVAALVSRYQENFDFTPGDLLVQRSQNGYNHLGDIDLRLRVGSEKDWTNYSTATNRIPVVELPPSNNQLAAADLGPVLPANFPLRITRSWLLENGKLALRFELKNKISEPVEVGALGLPMVFNNVLNNRSLEQAHAKCSFYDPYIGEDAGYLQVTRLSGQGPALVVVPDGNTPFEAYNPILDRPDPWGAKPVFTDPTPRGITFEGFYEWMVHSQAYAGSEWKNAWPWNPPTSLTLAPGQSKSYGVKFLLSDSIRGIEKTLAASQRPVAIGVPGYVLPTDIDGRLFLQYPETVKAMTVQPKGGLILTRLPQPSKAWQTYGVKGKIWGRSRLTVSYEDGLRQTIQYFVTKPESQVVADLGHFLMTKQWYGDSQDRFHRAPSVMTFDREANAIVTQDSRAWIAGLGDEGGGGAWISAVMKQLVQPNREELEKIQQFVDGVLWGGLQYKNGPNQYGVRKSLFYYQPDQIPASYYRSDLDWSSWTSWNKQQSERVDRSYDYPHVAAAYWVLYRLARGNQNLVTNHSWDWYLNHAYETSQAMIRLAPNYAVFGQMEGSIFVRILDDLKSEGMKDQADKLETSMRTRAEHWKNEAYPFGSEMPWDSTGQEEVYAWTKYFGYREKSEVTLNAILGYDPSIPHWGYNGSARRYWDFIFAAKDRRLERQLHHYGSGLNAIPVLAEYRDHPDDIHLLRVGYGGTMGALTDIDEEGFASAAFHSFPDMLKADPLSGDYGPNFFGYAWNTATYVVQHPELGWLAFGGNLAAKGNLITVVPLDSYRSRIYLAPLGLWLTLDAGTFNRVQFDFTKGKVRLGFAPATQFTSQARLRIEVPAKMPGIDAYFPARPLTFERDAYIVPLSLSTTWVDLIAKRKP